MCAHGPSTRGRRSHAGAEKSSIRNSKRKCLSKVENFMIYIIILSRTQDGMVTMHDVLDAQWMLDNHRDGQ